VSHNLTVQVIKKDGRVLERGTRVTVWIEGFWKGGSMERYTNGTGHAYFETADDYESSTKLWISVPLYDQKFGPFSIGGGSYIYTVTLD
jgi:hypothetical protein